MNKLRISRVVVLRPDFVRYQKGRTAPILPILSDYIVVDRLSTFGTWPIADLMPMESLAKLSRMRDSLAGVIRRK